MAVNKETLEYRKTNNLCPRDGRPNVSGRKLCEKCLNAAAVKTERYRQRKIAACLCTNCGENKPIGSSRLCQMCKDKASKYCHNAHVKRYGNRKQAGICVDCRKPSESGKTMCIECLRKRSTTQKVRRNTFIADNLCSQCGKNPSVDDGKRCQICIDKRNDWYKGSSTQAKDKMRRDKNREAVLQHYGGKCTECGELRPECLAIDHIEGGGNTHRKKIGKYGSGFFKWLIDNKFPEGFQILCHNCNMGKHLNGGICPHQSRTTKTRPILVADNKSNDDQNGPCRPIMSTGILRTK